MKDLEGLESLWKDDHLGYGAIGDSFTNLIKSINDSKVISIEAGFGHGKTFFRRAWAQQLRASGELVIEIDAQQSDRTDDPIITFMGALLKAKPVSGKPLAKSLKDGSLKIAGIAARSFARALLRSGAEEVLDAVSGWDQDQTPDIGGLDKAIEELEAGMSKVAHQMIATHLAAETEAHPALTDGAAHGVPDPFVGRAHPGHVRVQFRCDLIRAVFTGDRDQICPLGQRLQRAAIIGLQVAIFPNLVARLHKPLDAAADLALRSGS